MSNIFDEQSLEKQLSDKESNLYPDDLEESIVEETTQQKPIQNNIKIEEQRQSFIFNENDSKAQLGWTLLNKEVIPTQGLFHDADVLHYVKSINTKQIRDYTSIEEDDTISISKKIDTMLSIATKMQSNNKKLSYRDIYDIDKLFYMFAIRDLTFYNITNPLKNPTKCTNTECRHEYHTELFSNNVIFFEPSDTIIKHYNPEENCMTLNLDTNESINIKLPTIGIKEKLNEYIQWRKKIGADINKNAVNILPYMDFDWRNIEQRTFDEFLTRMVGWSSELYSVVILFIREIKKCMSMKSVSKCPECGAEVTASIRFQGGFSDFFIIQGILERLR